jgi:hypothetical protein
MDYLQKPNFIPQISTVTPKLLGHGDLAKTKAKAIFTVGCDLKINQVTLVTHNL